MKMTRCLFPRFRNIIRHFRSYSSSQVIDRYHMKFSKCTDFSPTESVHGLICFQESSAKLIVWNPSTRQLLTLPKPKKSWERVKYFLGYDPIEGKHKVVCIPFGRNCGVSRVFTLGSAQESWRTVKIKHKHRADKHTSGRCINGVVYYTAYVYHTGKCILVSSQPGKKELPCGCPMKIKRSGKWVLMSFDVRSEKFNIIQLPGNIHWDPLIIYKGRLACVEQNTQENRITLCILKDAEKGKWSEKRFVAPFYHYDEGSNCNFKVQGVTHGGEFIYVPYGFYKSYYILFCDPVRNSFKRFELKGIVDEISIFNNGVRNGYMYLHAFPIESHMSL